MSHINVLQNGRLLGLPDGNVLSCCPKMNLLAISMNRTSIWMFRFNGERVYSVNNKAQILGLQWNLSGRFFAVSGSDNFVNIYDTNTGELVNKFATHTSLPITLISWASVKLEINAASEKALPFIKLFQQDLLKDLPKLSHEVNFYDTERAGGVISLQNASAKSQSMSISATNTNEDDSLLDYLLVVNANAMFTATFNNLFTVPDIELPEDCKFLRHEVKDDFFNQAFLAEKSSGELVLYKMEFSLSEPRQLSYVLEILKYASLLISMLNHITDQVNEMQKEATAFIALFDRYLSNLKDAIKEGSSTEEDTSDISEDELVEVLMEIVLTGDVPDYLNDYWLNQFGERGLNRLSKTGNDLYEATRKTAYAQVILAIEKILIILSDVRGICLACSNLYGDPLGMNVETLENSIELGKSMLVSFYKFILEFNEEQEQFNVFCNYVKVEIIERLSKQESDMELFFKAHPEIEVSSTVTMHYIDHYLTRPKIAAYLDVRTSTNDVVFQSTLEEGSLIKKLTNFKIEINQKLLPGIQEYIAGKSVFKLLGTMKALKANVDCHMVFSNDKILIARKSESKLDIFTFDKVGNKKSHEIEFPGVILSYELMSDSRIVLLLERSNELRELMLFDVPKSGSNIAFENLVIKQVLPFDTQSAFIPTYMTLTKDPSSSSLTGCVFDKTRRNYVIFKID